MNKNINCLSLILFLSVIWTTGNSQGVTIGSSLPANNSAILDLQSNSKGFLPPRMSTPQRIAIASPAAGLVVFDTDVSQLYLFDGVQWQLLSGNSMANSIRPPQQFQPPADQKGFGLFGLDVAITDNYAVVGAPGANLGATVSTGAVYVYKKGDFGGWSQVAKLYASDPQSNSNFGASVAIAGNYIVVGAPFFDIASTANAGKIYVFVKGVGDVWTPQGGFTNPAGFAANDDFGYDVAISTTSAAGPTIIVGAPYVESGGTNRGAAYTFRFNGASWNFQEAFAPLDLANSDNFGYEVNIDGDYCAVGAPMQNNGAVTDVGAVYIFVYAGPFILWGQQQKLTGYYMDSQSGFSMSLKGDVIAIGAPMGQSGGLLTNIVDVYQRSGTTWTLINEVYLTSTQGFDGKNRFGIGISIDNDNLMVSMPGGYLNHAGSGVGENLQGYVIVFKRSGNYYDFYKVINDNEPFNPYTTNFGNAVSMKNGYYIIGIPGKNSHIGAIAFGYIE